MAYDNLVNGSCFRFENNLTDTIISQCGRHIICDVKGNCCLAFSSVGKREGLIFKTINMEKKIISKIMVEIDGKLIDVTDLPKDEYEYFLELMNSLRMAYIAITDMRGKSKN